MLQFGYKLSNVDASAQDLGTFWDCIRVTPLLESWLRQWTETDEGLGSFPSDPTDPANWEKTPRPF